MNEEDSILLSPQQAADMLGISYKTLNRLADAGKVAVERSGQRGDRKYRLDVIRRFRHNETIKLAAEVHRNHPGEGS